MTRALAVRPLSDALRRLHEVYEETVAHGKLDWASGSPAQLESTIGDEWIGDRVEDAYTFASNLLSVGLEQLRALADLLGHDHGFWATVTLSRSVAEMASRAAYLLDTQVSGRERARRFANEHLLSLHEQVRLHVGGQMHEDVPALRAEIAAIEGAASSCGFTVHRPGNQQAPWIGDHRPVRADLRPGNAEVLAQQMGRTADGFDTGRTMYRAYSAISHGTWHGINEGMWSTIDGEATQRMRDDPFLPATLISLAVLSVLDALERRRLQYGGQPTSLESARNGCLILLSAYLGAWPPATPAEEGRAETVPSDDART
ncbi:hypothetical protein ACQP00_30340 [Dactylosporangium sp. CS-047395]|uniref:hypothetical protein n=1 Tax=Dactylosporangium sp. CS-047395 TaxID=3239936 RepID=UPI003D941D8C